MHSVLLLASKWILAKADGTESQGQCDDHLSGHTMTTYLVNQKDNFEMILPTNTDKAIAAWHLQPMSNDQSSSYLRIHLLCETKNSF